MTLRLNHCNLLLERGTPGVPTLEIHNGLFYAVHMLPTPSPVLQHARLWGTYKSVGPGPSGGGWRASNLRMLVVHLQQYSYHGGNTLVDGAWLPFSCTRMPGCAKKEV